MLRIRDKKSGKVLSVSQASWRTICDRYQKAEQFEIVDGDVEIKPIATKRKIEEVEVPPMPELPEHEEVKQVRKRKKKSENE